MNHRIDFSPGPSQLYFTLETHLHKAFKEHIPTLSHRGKAFEHLYAHTVDQLREVLSVPTSHHVFFTSSATEIWELIIQNMVDKTSCHFVNGAFSEKFYQAAVALKKQVQKHQAADGEGFEDVPTTDAEVIAVTHNASSTGVVLPTHFIHALKEKNPHALLAVDAVSSVPHAQFDYSKIDSVYFSVQKAFGLPPGLGVWIVNDRCIAKAEELMANGKSIGTYHSLPSLLAYSAKNQTPQTPNTLAIYLLGKVAEDMIKKGIQTIRKETSYKAALLYQALQKHAQLQPFVKAREFQSPTVIVAESHEYTTPITQFLASQGVVAGGGYGTYKTKHLRFANFPTHSKEQVERLVDLIEMA